MFSGHCVKQVDENWNFNPVFDDVRNKIVSAHCTVTLNVLTVITDENMSNLAS